MLHQMNRLSLQSPLKILCVLVLHLLLTHSCRGQSQLIGSSQPIVATVGHDVILPCQLKPAEDVSVSTVKWIRPDLSPREVHVRRAGHETITAKHPSYQERTSLFIDGLKQGNISLKLSRVKLSDGGNYTCYIPHINKESFIELVVVSDVIPSPLISVALLDRVRGGAVLQCESEGWYPQPEVLWLDSEGSLLSAEPTKTVRGPYGLYTVSSRVTVKKRHNNNFTCRVQQKNINQTSETHFIVPDDFFKAQSSSSSSAIIGVAVGLVVFIVVVAVFFFVWKWKQNKTKRSCTDEGDPEMQPLSAAGTDGITLKTLQDEQQKREKAEEKVQTLEEELEEKKQKIEKLLKLHEENQRTMKDLQTLKENLETKNKELENMKDDWFKGSKKEKAAKVKEVETLKEEHQTKQEEFETKTKEIEDIKAELQRKELDRQRQKEETKNKELETDQTAPVQSSSSLIETLQESEKQLKAQNEEWERKQAELLKEKQDREKEVKDLKNQLDSTQKQWEEKQADTDRLLQEEKLNREKEVKDMKNQLESKQKQIKNKQAECDLLMKLQQLLEENQRREERDLQTLEENMETKTKELENMKAGWFKGSKEKKAAKEKEVETLKKELQTKQEKFDTNTKAIKEIKAELQQLRDENQRKETRQ